MLLKKIKISNFQYLILFLLLTLWLFVRSNQSDLSNFIQTHHLFNYEHEFLKRALVGEILRLSVENLNSKDDIEQMIKDQDWIKSYSITHKPFTKVIFLTIKKLRLRKSHFHHLQTHFQNIL